MTIDQLKQSIENSILQAYFQTFQPSAESSETAEKVAATILTLSQGIQEPQRICLSQHPLASNSDLSPEVILTQRNIVIITHADPETGGFKTMRTAILVDRSNAMMRRVAVLDVKPSKCDSREIYLLKKFSNHGFVPELIEYYSTKNEEGSIVSSTLIESLCLGGDLKEFAKCQPSLERIPFIIYQILKIVKIFHSEGFALRDVKPANFLLKNRTPDQKDITNNEVVICDIGSAYQYNISSDPEVPSSFGTAEYMSPESAQIFLSNTGRLTSNRPPADVWAIGRCAAELLNDTALKGYTSPASTTPTNQFMSLLHHLSRLSTPPIIPTNASPIVQLTASLLNPSSSQRPTARRALQSLSLRKALLSSTPFMRALISQKITIDELYQDLFEHNFPQLLEKYKLKTEEVCIDELYQALFEHNFPQLLEKYKLKTEEVYSAYEQVIRQRNSDPDSSSQRLQTPSIPSPINPSPYSTDSAPSKPLVSAAFEDPQFTASNQNRIRTTPFSREYPDRLTITPSPSELGVFTQATPNRSSPPTLLLGGVVVVSSSMSSSD